MNRKRMFYGTLIVLSVSFVLSWFVIAKGFQLFLRGNRSSEAGVPRYEDNISIHPTFASYYLSKSGRRDPRPYTTVIWDITASDATSECPLTVTIDDEAWRPEDFEMSNFLKRGPLLLDPHVATGGIAPKSDPEKDGYFIFYYSEQTCVNIMCSYTPNKELIKVSVSPGSEWHDGMNGWKDNRPPLTFPLKAYSVSFHGRTVVLPADYKTLVESLGEPLNHGSPKDVYGLQEKKY